MKDKNLEDEMEYELAGELVKRLEKIPENKRDFHQNLLLAIVKQYDPTEKIYSAPAEFVPEIHRDVIEFLKKYEEFERKSKESKFVISYNSQKEDRQFYDGDVRRFLIRARKFREDSEKTIERYIEGGL